MSTSVIRLMHQISIIDYELNELAISLISTMATLGNIIGAIICPFIAKCVGRKKTIIIASMLNVIVCSCYMVSVHWIFTCVLRLLNGIFTFIAQTIAPSWLADLSPPENKSVLNKYFELFIAIGMLINNLLLFIVSDEAELYRIAMAYGIFVALACAICAFIVKENNKENTT